MKSYKSIVIVLMLIGLFLRTFAIDKNPPSLYWDEASIAYEAYSVSRTGKDMHGHSWLQAIFPAYGDYKAPVYIWAASVSMIIFGPNDFALRFPSALFGTLSIAFIYLFVNQLFKSKHIGIFTAIALTFLPAHIQFSRTGFEANAGLFFFIVFLYAFIKALEDLRWLSLVLASSLFGVYSYFSARIVIPLVAIWLTLFLVRSRKQILCVSSFFIIFTIGLIPLYTSPHFKQANSIRLSTDNISNNAQGIEYSNSLKSDDKNTVFSKAFHHRYIYQAKELAKNMFSHLDVSYLFLTGDKNERHSTGFAGVALPVSFVAFSFGFLVLLKQLPKWAMVMGLWAITLLPASVPREIPHALRSLNAVVPIVIVMGVGLNALRINGSKSRVKKILVGVYAVLLVINFCTYYFLLQNVYPKKTNLAWQDGYPQLGTYVAKVHSQYDYIVVVPGDRLFLYVLWYGKIDPQIVQKNQIESLSKNKNAFSLTSINKINFRPISWKEDKFGPSSSILIGEPQDFPPETKIQAEIRNTNNEVEFVSVALNDL